MTRSKLFYSIQCATFLGAIASQQALAQEEKSLEVEEVVVTGSRIVRPNMVSSTAVNTLDAEDIKVTGAVNISEVLTAMPGAGVSGFTSTNSNFSSQGSGVNTVNLRNLGESRTLVLVNGRRFVAGIPGSQVVDLNSIPTQFIERVDVVTGGASAVYGSDALAGVVNIILKEDFEGFEVSTQTGQTFEGDDETHSLSLTGGFTFDEDKGNAMFSLGYSTEGGVFARDRDGLERDGYSTAALESDSSLWSQTTTPFYSSYSERGRIIIPGAGNYVVDDSVVRAFQSADDDGNAVDGFNRQAFRALSVPTDRLNASATINLNVADNLTWFTELTYASTETNSAMEPMPLASADIYGDNQANCTDTDGDDVNDTCNGFGVSINNPFVPEEMRRIAREANAGVSDDELILGFVRRTTELDPRGADNLRQTFRVVTGFKGSFLDDFNYELSFNYGRTHQDQKSSGQINVLNFRRALEAEALFNNDGDITGYQCTDEIARAQGCVPVNVFGLGSMTEGMTEDEARNLRDWLQADSSRANMIEQTIATGFVAGPMFELPGGTAMFSTGFEYRDEYSEQIPDGLTQQGLNAGNKTPPTVGGYDVSEAFVEFSLPILADLPLVSSLEMDIAARFSDYSTVGQTSAYAAALRYSPNDDLMVRTQFSRAVRAPNINELFGALSQTFPQVVDPCNGVTVDASGAPGFLVNNSAPAEGIERLNDEVAVACMQDPAVAARVAERGSMILDQAELQGVSGFNGGALAAGNTLTEETADTFTVGFVWNPSFADWAEPLSVTMDYYDIEIEDALGTLGRGTSLSNCYVGGQYDPSSPFCGNITRFGRGSPSVGALRFVNAYTQNVASLKTTGLDIDVSYDFDLNNFGLLQASVNYTHLLNEESTPFDGAEVVDTKGTLGSAEHKANMRLRYTNGDASVTWTSRFISASTFTNNENSFWYGEEVPSQLFHNLQAGYSLTDGIRLNMGIDNITDEYVHIGMGAPGTSTGWDTAPDVYDALGRRYYMGVTAKF